MTLGDGDAAMHADFVNEYRAITLTSNLRQFFFVCVDLVNRLINIVHNKN